MGDAAGQHAQRLQTLRPAHDLFHRLFGRDVHHGADDTSFLADDEHAGGQENTDDGAILAANIPFHPAYDLSLRELPRHTLAQRGVDPEVQTAFERALTHDLVQGVAGQGQKPVVGLETQSVRQTRDEKGIRAQTEHGFEAFLAAAQGLLAALTIRDVSHRSHDVALAAHRARAQAHLRPEATSICASRAPFEQLRPLRDGLVQPFGGAALRVVRPLLGELTDGHADEPFVCIAKDLASALVAIQDAARLGVVDEDGLVHGVVDRLQLFRAGLERGLSFFEGPIAPPERPVQQQCRRHHEEPALAGIQRLHDGAIVREVRHQVIGKRDPQRGNGDIASHDESQLGTQ